MDINLKISGISPQQDVFTGRDIIPIKINTRLLMQAVVSKWAARRAEICRLMIAVVKL